MQEQITYEFPLSEYVRTFLRLEDLFGQMHHFAQYDSECQAKAELSCLLNILAISSRTNLRNAVTKEIEHQTKSLAIFTHNPNVDGAKLERTIEQLQQLNIQLRGTSGRLEDILDQVELLKSLEQRVSIPGGACEFDLPAYNFWLNKPFDERRKQIQSWTANLAPIHQAITLLLQFVRSSAAPTAKTAQAGFYQQGLDANQSIKLLRVTVKSNVKYFAEISGDKHRFTVRFMEPQETERTQQTNEDILFELSICQL